MPYRMILSFVMLAALILGGQGGQPARGATPQALTAPKAADLDACDVSSGGVYLPLLATTGSGAQAQRQVGTTSPQDEPEDDHENVPDTDPAPLGELVLSGASLDTFNPLDPALTIALTCGRIQSQQISVNGLVLPASALSRSASQIAFTPALQPGANAIAMIGRDHQGALIQNAWTVWAGDQTLDVSVSDPDGNRLVGVPVVAELAEESSITAIATTVQGGVARFENLPDRSLLLSVKLADGRLGNISALGSDVYAGITVQGASDEPPSPIDNNDFSLGSEGWNIGDTQVTFVPHIEGPLPAPTLSGKAPQGRSAPTNFKPAAAQAPATPLAHERAEEKMNMVLTTRGEGPQTVSRVFTSKGEMTSVTIRFRFVTTEISGGYFGSQYDDTFTVVLRNSDTGEVETFATSMNRLGFGAFGQGGDTGWFNVSIPVTPVGDEIEVYVTVQNIGDGQLDSTLEIYEIIESATPWAKLGTVDGLLPAIKGSKLKLQQIAGLNGNTAGYIYEWFRSATLADGSYTPVVTSTTTSEYTVVEKDAGHRFKVRVTDTDGNQAESNIIAIGPSKTPTPLYPITTVQPVRVTSPYVSFTNSQHDASDVTPAPAYTYEVQVASDSAFATVLHSAQASGPEIANNNNISYLRIPGPLPVTVTSPQQNLFWRVRAVVAGAPGRWSTTNASFYIAEVISPDGLTWHDPILAVPHDQLRVTGTFNEAYHSGDLQTHLHGGLDYGSFAKGNVTLCNLQTNPIKTVPIYSVRGGILKRISTQSVRPVVIEHEGLDRRTRYLHMVHSTNTPLTRGIYLNQGTEVGTMSNQPGGYPCHLHLDLVSANEQTMYNPLSVLSWTDTYSPTIPASYIRTDNLLDSTNTGIVTNVHFIADVGDPVPATSIVGPHKLEFTIDDQVQCQTVGGRHMCSIQFDELTSAAHEHDFYAFYDAAHDGLNASGGNVGGNPNNGGEDRITTHSGHYFMYLRWAPPANRADDAGPLRVRMRAYDYYGNMGERSMTIGPELTTNVPIPTNAPTPTLEVDSGVTYQITVTLRNSNTGISNRPEDAGTPQMDSFTVTRSADPGITITTAMPATPITLSDQDRATGTKTQSYVLNVKATQSGNIRIVAQSGTLPFVKDAVTIRVNVRP